LISKTDGKRQVITLLGDMSRFAPIRAALSDVSSVVAAYIAVVLGLALTIAIALLAAGVSVGSWWGVVALAAVATLGERGRIRLRGNLDVSISLLPATFAAVLYGPLAGMLVFGTAVLGLSLPLPGRLAYLGSRAITGAAAAGVATAVAALVAPGPGEIVAASTVAALTAETLDALFASIAYRLRGVGSFLEALRELVPVIIASVPLYSPAVALLVLAYREISPLTLPLFFAPALAAQRWFLMYQEQRRLATDLGEANDQLRAANLSFAKGLIATLDARDQYTAGHSAAVAIYARDIARRMDLSVSQQDLAHLCGLVHDIGKIGLPAGLLEKPGALTLDERREMQRHSEIGERILANVDTYAEIAGVVRHHHERVDGQGYPDGLSGNQIPLLSRIIAVADAYNAMTSDRPYRDAMPSRVARLRLAQAVETQFDTAVVAAFEAILAGAQEDYRLARSAEFFLAVGDRESDLPFAAPFAVVATV
jgi:putative nucleotidyltransferase with HDIG domain